MSEVTNELYIMAGLNAQSQILFVREWATFAHQDQKYGDKPYIHHLEEVHGIIGIEHETDLLSFDAIQRARICFLHDVIEDTDVTVELLQRCFGKHVARQVDLISDKPGVNRKARKAALYDVLNFLGPNDYDALLVKAADRLANIRASHAGNPGLLKMYREEHPQFVDAVHRHGLLTNAWVEMAELLDR